MNKNLNMGNESGGSGDDAPKRGNRGSGPSMSKGPGGGNEKKEYLGFSLPGTVVRRIRLAATSHNKQPGEYIWDTIEEQVERDLEALGLELGSDRADR